MNVLFNWRVVGLAVLLVSYAGIWYKATVDCRATIIGKSAQSNIDTRIKQNEIGNLRPDSAGLADSLHTGDL